VVNSCSSGEDSKEMCEKLVMKNDEECVWLEGDSSLNPAVEGRCELEVCYLYNFLLLLSSLKYIFIIINLILIKLHAIQSQISNSVFHHLIHLRICVDGVVEKSLMRRHAKQVVQGIVLG
jgi:hypothetical protein